MLRKILGICCTLFAMASAISMISDLSKERIMPYARVESSERTDLQTPRDGSPGGNVQSEALPASDKESDRDAQRGYMLLQCSDGIEIYKNGEDIPVKTIKFNVASLPPGDRQILSAGLFVPDEKRLQAAIEDYTG
ncbi:MAG: hypothetical protein IKS19_00240 [Clostridia bacterium]|nr:hypothetical protein [Clostridia bacterium]